MQKLMKVNYDVTMEQLSAVKCSLGSIISDESWKSRLRNATKTMTKMRWFGSRAFNDFLLSNVIHGEVDIRTDCSLKNISRACFTIDTQGPKLIKSRSASKHLMEIRVYGIQITAGSSVFGRCRSTVGVDSRKQPEEVDCHDCW